MILAQCWDCSGAMSGIGAVVSDSGNEVTGGEVAPEAGGQVADGGTSPSETVPEAPVPGAEALGDAGKKALDAMKAERNKARQEMQAVTAELAALKAAAEGREAEHKAALEAQRVQDEALAKANDRIRKAEVRAQAATKLADPADALRFLDLDSVEVGEDGEVDAAAVTAAIDQLLVDKPYLAAQGRRFQGSADAGARNDASKVGQLSREDLAGMSSAEIVKARAEGRLNDVLGIK